MNKEGFIIRSNAGLYDVFCDDKIYVSKPRGKFRKEFKHPLVGDNVVIETLNDKEGYIEKAKISKEMLFIPSEKKVWTTEDVRLRTAPFADSDYIKVAYKYVTDTTANMYVYVNDVLELFLKELPMQDVNAKFGIGASVYTHLEIDYFKYCRVIEFKLFFRKTVAFELFGNKMLSGNIELFFFGIARKLNNLHSVKNGSRNCGSCCFPAAVPVRSGATAPRKRAPRSWQVCCPRCCSAPKI
mgnify:CR=1 FL=1